MYIKNILSFLLDKINITKKVGIAWIFRTDDSLFVKKHEKRLHFTAFIDTETRQVAQILIHI